MEFPAGGLRVNRWWFLHVAPVLDGKVGDFSVPAYFKSEEALPTVATPTQTPTLTPTPTATTRPVRRRAATRVRIPIHFYPLQRRPQPPRLHRLLRQHRPRRPPLHLRQPSRPRPRPRQRLHWLKKTWLVQPPLWRRRHQHISHTDRDATHIRHQHRHQRQHGSHGDEHRHSVATPAPASTISPTRTPTPTPAPTATPVPPKPRATGIGRRGCKRDAHDHALGGPGLEEPDEPDIEAQCRGYETPWATLPTRRGRWLRW